VLGARAEAASILRADDAAAAEELVERLLTTDESMAADELGPAHERAISTHDDVLVFSWRGEALPEVLG
jgi:hypothetical protein